MSSVYSAHAYASVSLWVDDFGEEHRMEERLLFGDEAADVVDFGCVNKGALYSDRFATLEVEHVSLAYELVGT